MKIKLSAPSFILTTLAVVVLTLLASGLLLNVGAVGEVREVARWSNLHDSPGGTVLAGAALEPGTQVTELNRDQAGHWVLVESPVGNGWLPVSALAGGGIETAAPNAPPADEASEPAMPETEETAPEAEAADPEPEEESGNARITRWTNLFDKPAGKVLPNTPLSPDMMVTVMQFNADGFWALVNTKVGNGWVPANALNVRLGENGELVPIGGASDEGADTTTEGEMADSADADANSDAESADTEPTAETETDATVSGSPKITGVVINSTTSRESLITLSYTGIPLDGYVPFFYIFDPDNCVVDCKDPDNALEYPVHGITTITDGIMPSGTVDVAVALDNLYCGADVWTKRLVAVIADARPLEAGESTRADDLIEWEFDHLWCD